MKTVVIHGKVLKPISPKVQYPDADLWGCTHTQLQYRRMNASLDNWDEWFELHGVEPTSFYPGVRALRPKALAWYRTLPPNDRPLWMLDHYPDIPASQRFPIEEVMAAFPIEDDPGQPTTGMWTCQVDYLMAFAILRKYDCIVLHGHGISQSPAHMASHFGILYWVAVARERGIQVTIHAPSWYRAPRRPYGIASGGWGREHGKIR